MRSVLPPRRAVWTRPFRELGAIAGVLLASTLARGLAAGAEPDKVQFSRDVLPIFSENCLLCHGPDARTRKADLRLDVKESVLRASEPLIVPGKSGESQFIERIESDDPELVMPPPRSGRKLTAAQKAVLRRWVDQGAPWGKHWSFETPVRPEPPRVRDAGWPRNPIDQFVLHSLEQTGLKPSAEADRTTLIRRLSLDLTGLPPTPAEVDAFVGSRSPRAYEEVVDRLLSSVHYGERMAVDWLDAARYADTNGYQNDFARTMWPWRDWVIAAFNRNQRFDQFLTQQIAGDLLPGATLEQRVATGFNRNNRTVTEGGSIDEEWRIENAVDRVETTATVFLGLTMGCGRCHDHKYDPITQKEFYEFLAFFSAINEKGVYTETRGNVPPLVAVPSPDQAAELARLSAAVAAAGSARETAEKSLQERQQRWERELQDGPEPGESRDWTLRCLSSGSLRFQGPLGEAVEGVYRGAGEPQWTEAPRGKAIRLDGKPASFVEVALGASLDRGDRFSLGGWVRPRGDGACLSKMDDRNGYRGYDLLLEGGKLAVHLVHSWPGDALKVVTKEALPRDAWTHVLVTSDGSGKAAGLTVYLDGRPVAVDVATDTLRGTTVSGQPLRLGSRSTGLPLTADLADVRIYRRTLSAADVGELAAGPLLALARTPAAERTKDQGDLLARYYRDQVDLELRQADDLLAQSRKRKADFEATIPTLMVMEDLPAPRPTYVLKRGRYDMPDMSQKVSAGVPACLNAMPAGAPANRLGLARWLSAPENPLTARVAVNRLWQQHFGTGLVKSAENFGVQSEPPSHPALLDWLATEFVRLGWDVKAMHRLIVQSATYRQTSKVTPEQVQRDPENRLLSRGPRYRLSGEFVRDNALAIAGLLAPRVGGPSVKPYQPAGLWEELAGGAGEGPYVQSKGADLYRRGLYVYRKRTVPHPAMANFDAPSREICQVQRARTNTPLQALELLNDVTYLEASRSLAQLMLASAGPSPADRVTLGFRRATARAPAPAELEVLLRGLERYRESFRSQPELAARWIHQGEHPVPANADVLELAAYTAAASVILNLDETITVE